MTSGLGNDFIIGDSGTLTFGVTGRLRTAVNPDQLGGDDQITVQGGNNVVIGGTGRDAITTGNGVDIILGDVGTIDYVVDDNDETDIDRVVAPGSTLGNDDVINSGDGDAFVFGQTGSDTITSGAGRDMIFGDHGQLIGNIDASFLPLTVLADPFTFTSIDTQASYSNSNDFIRAGAGDDIVLGGQGADRIMGQAGDDDIIGGHNVADGADANDTIDAGSGVDVVAGDNATITREPRNTDTRWRVLAGTQVLEADGNGNVTATPQADPSNRPKRTISLLNHTATTAAGVFGSDIIAGGSGDDTIFGQLGNDAIQGDGSVLNLDGSLVRDITVTKSSVDDIDGLGTDGDDYIEGGGGNDVIVGNLGQDDIIGGSSNLFGTTTTANRPDGQDLIFGGSGTKVGRNDLGDETTIGHARDADVILGDNGNIFRLVGINGVAGAGHLVYNYDTYGSLKIVPRTIQYLEYAFGDANNTQFNDEIHGEAGDDMIHGMSGHDVLFGDAQDDNIIGGAGSDRIFGGSGEDGILGDDGRIFTSRNGLTEPLNGVTTATTQSTVVLPNTQIGALTHITGLLKKSVDLASYRAGSDDLIYGGLGDDFIHGGFGDDAISGAEATASWFITTPLTGASLLNYNATTRMFANYLPGNSLAKINGFLLNFDATDGNGNKIVDGTDHLFGDEGNDWIVGGTMNDRMYGGMGDDLLNADDNLETSNGLNNAVDSAPFADADFAFGGGGFDVMIGNTGGDRLIDWIKRFNTYVVPIKPTTQSSTVASPTVLRDPSPALTAFLLSLAASSGYDTDTDAASNAFFAEMGLVTSEDGQTWFDQQWIGADRDPLPGNLLTGIDTQGAIETISSAGIRIIETSAINVSEYGAPRPFHVVLTAPPASNVVLTITSSNTAEVVAVTTQMTFTPLNWFIPQAVQIAGVDDTIIDGTKNATITVAVNATSSAATYATVPAATIQATNTDNDLTIPVVTGLGTTALQRPEFSWTADPGAAGYEVWINNVTTGQAGFAQANVTTNRFVPTSDLGIGQFNIWVRSTRTDGIKGAWSTGVGFRINSAVTMTSVPANSAVANPELTWAPLAGSVRYEVLIANLTTGQSAFIRETNVTTTTWRPSTNMPMGSYRVWVRGIDAKGVVAGWSTAADFRISTAPVQVTPVGATFNRTPTFTWNPVAGAAAYTFQLRNVATGTDVYLVSNLTATSFTPPAALADGNYRWWVQARTAANVTGLWSAPVDLNIGGAVRFTTPTGVYGIQPTFEWLAVGGVARYEIQVNRIDVAQANVVRETNVSGSATSFTIPTPLVSGGIYRIWIRAISTTGETSAWSPTLQFSIV